MASTATSALTFRLPAQPRVTVVGAGAIGGHVAARLRRHGHDVSLLARGATLHTLRADGLRYTSADGITDTLTVRAEANATVLGVQDLIVLAVKAPSLPALAPALTPLLGPDTVVLPLTNGLPWWFCLAPGAKPPGLRLRAVDPTGALERTLPLAKVLGGSIMASCASPAPGVIVHRAGGQITLGEPAGGLSERAQAWATWLSAAGLPTNATPDIRSALWLKLLGNICSNPLSLLTGCTTDRLLDDPAVSALYATLMQECLDLGLAMGLTLPVNVTERMAQTRAMGAIRSSMLQDLDAGRPVELDAIMGSVLACATALRHPVPRLHDIHALACLRAASAGCLG